MVMMNRAWRTVLGIGLCTMLLGGCAMPTGWPGGAASVRTADQVPDPDVAAQDLVQAIAQVRSLNPLQTTLEISAPLSPFGERVFARLEEAGYGMRLVESDQGPRYVRYSSDRLVSERGTRDRFAVRIGEIALERDYTVLDGVTVPSSPFLLDGALDERIAVDDGLFERAVPVERSRVHHAEDAAPVMVRFDARGREQAVPLLGAAAEAARPEFAPRVRENVFERAGRSNYQTLFVAYENVREDTLVFDNDSMRLGEGNKGVIAEYVREMDPATDVISVIGCSHGRSALSNGNELLSIGRANRVKEAFVYAGIDHAAVLEEACWAPTSDVGLPPRGVVLSLKRRADAG